MDNAETLSILIVDDEEQALKQICKFLEMEIPDLKIKTALDGDTALAVCREWQPLVVMSDINMPRRNGIELLDQVKKDLPETQVVLFTGREDNETPVLALRMGASDYLRKPLDLDELVITCKRAIERAMILKQNRLYREQLEQAVAARTQELQETNERLNQEIAERGRLAAAVDQVAELITVSDTEGRIEYVNQAFERVTGYLREEVIGKTHAILKSGQHDQEIYKAMWDTILAGKIWSGHLINKNKHGELYEEEATITPLRDAQGKIINFVAVKRDVTAEMKLRKQLRQSQKMEAIGTLAGGIAHDFNNILFAIQGYSDLVADQLRKHDMDLADIEEVKRASDRATDLVHQILTFSRQTEKRYVRVRLSSIVKEVLKLLRASLPATIEISQQIQAATAEVLADPTQVHQILMNLCTNAWHAMADTGGHLSISLRELDLRDDQVRSFKIKPGPYVILSVADTGSGIPGEIREKIFEPFFTTKDYGDGTGMGLSVVHGIVTSMGGAISVYSEIGEGTTFNVYLPKLTGVEHDAAGQRKVDATGSERILLIDDEKQLLTMLARLLGNLGYQVTTFDRPEAALENFIADPAAYDLVITDRTMPRLTGEDLAVRLLEARPDLPIILCTGFAQKVTRDHAMKIGIKAYLDKPVNLDVLGATIRELLDEGK